MLVLLKQKWIYHIYLSQKPYILKQKGKIARKIRKCKIVMHSLPAQRGSKVIILLNCLLFFFHSCDGNIMMPRSYSKYSDLLGMVCVLDSAFLKGFFGDWNMQHSLRTMAPGIFHGFALRVVSIFSVGWPCRMGRRTHWESVIITTVHPHKGRNLITSLCWREVYNWPFMMKNRGAQLEEIRLDLNGRKLYAGIIRFHHKPLEWPEFLWLVKANCSWGRKGDNDCKAPRGRHNNRVKIPGTKQIQVPGSDTGMPQWLAILSPTSKYVGQGYPYKESSPLL